MTQLVILTSVLAVTQLGRVDGGYLYDQHSPAPLSSAASPRGTWYSHREDRVQTFFSSRWNWDSPTPSPEGKCAPSPTWFRGEGHNRLREKGWGAVPILTRSR